MEVAAGGWQAHSWRSASSVANRPSGSASSRLRSRRLRVAGDNWIVFRVYWVVSRPWRITTLRYVNKVQMDRLRCDYGAYETEYEQYSVVGTTVRSMYESTYSYSTRSKWNLTRPVVQL